MQAITIQAPRQLVCETVPDPEILEPTDAIVKVELTAICGSDLHVYHGRETGIDAGCVMGHEFLGEVVERGSGVALTTGSVVVSPFTTSCGACFFCRHGLSCRCEKGGLFGWVEDGTGLQGAQAEYVRVPLADGSLVEVAEGVDHEQALFAGDVLSTGWYCAAQGGAAPGRTVAVIGCGPVGLMAVIGARELGADRVFAVDRVAERLELARQYGATPINGAEVDVVAELRDRTDGRGVDAALEAVGNDSAARLAYHLVRAGGTISTVGVHTSDRLSFSPVEAYDKNLTYRIGRCPARSLMDETLALIGTGRYDLSRIISHRLPLAEGVAGYQMFDRKEDGCTKIVLSP